MIILRNSIILLFISFTCSVAFVYDVKQITKSIGTLLVTPNWSVEDQTLYFIDFFEDTFYRLNGNTGNVTSGKICSKGPFGLITPLKGASGYVIVGIQTSLYIMNCNAPNVGDSLRLFTTVDLGKPENNILDGKVDAAGRLFFGTLGKILSASTAVPDQASFYMITSQTYTCPRVVLRPVSTSTGHVWSLDNKKFYYNDAVTREIVYYDYNFKKGEIANKQLFFSFYENDIDGIPNGMTIDSAGNIWVATHTGAEVLRICATTGNILLRIKLDVDIVTSITWGGKYLDILYATTGSILEPNPKLHSGSLFAITAKGCRGVPQNFFKVDDVENY